jgi:glucokinase
MNAAQASSARIGVDIGGTRIKAARVLDGVVQARSVAELSAASQTPEGLAAAVAQVVGPLAEGATKLGAGVAAVIGSDDATVLASPNMPFLDGIDLANALEQATGMTVRLDNDVNVVGLGEALVGAGRGVPEQICLALGTGLGGAIVRRGQLHRGHRGRAAELGHLTVDPHGAACGCGGRGCAEQYASQTGLLRMMAEAGWRPANSSNDPVIALFDAATAGDQIAHDLVQRAGWALGMTIAWCCEMFAPQRVIIAGGISAAWPQLRPATLAALQSAARPSALCRSVQAGTLGADAGTIGAAMLFDQVPQMRR